MIHGSHAWMYGPEDKEFYVGAVDLAGESRPKDSSEVNNKRDSTVLTIASIGYNEMMLPALEIVHTQIWLGTPYLEQYAMISELYDIWNIRKLVVDKTGLGEMMGSMLQAKLGEERVQLFHFTRPSKSALTFHFLSLVNSGRLKLYDPEEAPKDVYEEAWKQLRLARYTVPAKGQLSFHCNPSEAHDDVLISIALCTEAIREFETPVTEAEIVRPRPLYRDGRY